MLLTFPKIEQSNEETSHDQLRNNQRQRQKRDVWWRWSTSSRRRVSTCSAQSLPSNTVFSLFWALVFLSDLETDFLSYMLTRGPCRDGEPGWQGGGGGDCWGGARQEEGGQVSRQIINEELPAGWISLQNSPIRVLVIFWDCRLFKIFRRLRRLLWPEISISMMTRKLCIQYELGLRGEKTFHLIPVVVTKPSD